MPISDEMETGYSNIEDVSGFDLNGNDRKRKSSPVTSCIFSLKDGIGDLVKALQVLQNSKLNIKHIETRPSKKSTSQLEYYVEFETQNGGLNDVKTLLKEQVADLTIPENITPPAKTPKDECPWFPKSVSELDQTSNRVLMYGADLDAEHPGFKDEVYRKRRILFAEIAFNFKHGHPIPRVEYTEEENRTWSTIYRELRELYKTHACRQQRENLPLLEQNCGYGDKAIPQLDDVSRFLQKRTGFQLRPVAGYLSSRDFLAGLAFRVFHCTQYIRHSSDPFYTPEPDCCHELLGHMPLLADKTFAQFAQEIGLASLGASDEEVARLATCFFFTIEFGLCKENSEMRVYGAGLLSSVGELRHVLSDKAVVKQFEPEVTSKQECKITTYQDCYFSTGSFEEATFKMREYAKSIKRPFELKYDPYTNSVEVLDTAASLKRAVEEVQETLLVISSALSKITH
ncbi:tryptophan 5-hydroxylase 1-like isoform X2 [Lineus longissimus]|uniref:tryptophan 5-hydroxylase 1-like isoform X2 n=1 Tax=Lineus longissimus TaxID=88925 RepID=UPI00315D8094